MVPKLDRILRFGEPPKFSKWGCRPLGYTPPCIKHIAVYGTFIKSRWRKVAKGISGYQQKLDHLVEQEEIEPLRALNKREIKQLREELMGMIRLCRGQHSYHFKTTLAL